MKNLILWITALTLTSCNVTHKGYIGKTTMDPKPDKILILSWGDDRFHDCNELKDEIFHVYGSDTIHVATHYRKTVNCN